MEISIPYLLPPLNEVNDFENLLRNSSKMIRSYLIIFYPSYSMASHIHFSSPQLSPPCP